MPHFSSTIKDPWEIEHEIFLRLNPNAIAHSDTFYTGVIHKGFDADDTAVELIRRYPAFEEAEEHRKFLVHSLSERLVLSGQTNNYFTPEQLWEEEDRVMGKGCFLEGKSESEVEDEEEEEEESEERPADAEPVDFAITTPESPKDDRNTSGSGLPITFQTGDHTTTITRHYAAVQLLLDTLDVSHDVSPLRAITHCAADGSLVLALLGHLPTDTNITYGHRTAEKKAPTCCHEWRTVSGRPDHPTTAFFSGAETCSDLVEEIGWSPESIVATSLVYEDGRVLVLVVGEVGEQFDGALNGMRRCEEVPAEHAELVGLLQVVQRDMLDMGTV